MKKHRKDLSQVRNYQVCIRESEEGDRLYKEGRYSEPKKNPYYFTNEVLQDFCY
jgi:hypothetical protein